MSGPNLAVVGRDDFLRVTIDTRGVQDVLQAMPKAAYFWLHRFLMRTTIDFRTSWLRNRGTKFGRRENGGMVVQQVNAKQTLGPKDIGFEVRPYEPRAGTSADAVRRLRELQMTVGTGSVVMAVHEFGTDIKTATFMAVPVKTRPGNIERWKAKNPGARLLFLPSKRGTGEVLVYEKQHRGRFRALSGRTQARLGLGRPLAPIRNQSPAGNWQRLRLRWVLTKTVNMRPTLELYATWGLMKAHRDALWADSATGMVRDLQKRDPRDL